jgi:hypothetical protein
MNLAVKFWSDVPNPKSVPGAWPAQCREIGAATSYTAEAGPWTIMTAAAYEAYRAQHQAAYDSWEAANPIPMAGGQ